MMMPNKSTIGRVSALCLALAGSGSAMSQDWQNAITPYIWGSGMSGKVAVGTPLGTVESNVDLNFGEIMDNLDFGVMVSYEGKNDKWMVLGDLVFMNLGADVDSASGQNNVRNSADIEQSLLEADVGYRLTENMALFVGARFSDIDGEIGITTTGPATGINRSAGLSENWIDPVVGLLGQWELTEHWAWDLRADIGGFGVGSDFVWQAQAILRWKVRPNLDVIGSYRYMEVDFDQDGPTGLLVYDMINSGPGIGVTFHF
jgi:opacity protein-like surface antigen